MTNKTNKVKVTIPEWETRYKDSEAYYTDRLAELDEVITHNNLSIARLLAYQDNTSLDADGMISTESQILELVGTSLAVRRSVTAIKREREFS